MLDATGTLEPRARRTLDAVHLASAMAIGDDLEGIVTYDAGMLEASGLLGLPTVAPR